MNTIQSLVIEPSRGKRVQLERNTKHHRKNGKCDLIDEDRCTATTSSGRCRWAVAKESKSDGNGSSVSGSVGSSSVQRLCGHHQADVKRGCTASSKIWHSGGAQELRDVTKLLTLTVDTPLIALRTFSAHAHRVQIHMQKSPYNCSLKYSEKVRTGKMVLMLFAPLFPDCNLLGLLETIVADAPMVRILADLPVIVQHAAVTWSEAYVAYETILRESSSAFNHEDNFSHGSSSSRSVGCKFVTDPTVRKYLKEQKEVSEVKECDLRMSNESAESSEIISNKIDERDQSCLQADSKKVDGGNVSRTALCTMLSLYEGAVFLHGKLLMSCSSMKALLEAYEQVLVSRKMKQVCKAVLKIEEIFALRNWSNELNDEKESYDEVALDIGASPGSWSAWLLGYMQERRPSTTSGGVTDESAQSIQVIAVDPGDLLPEVVAMKGITHLRILVSSDEPESMNEISRSMQVHRQAGASLVRADVLVCDMNRHPCEAAALMRAIGSAGLLKEGARIVLTLKMPIKNEAARSVIETEALSILGDNFVDKQVNFLFANTPFEATVTATYSSRSDVRQPAALEQLNNKMF